MLLYVKFYFLLRVSCKTIFESYYIPDVYENGTLITEIFELVQVTYSEYVCSFFTLGSLL